MIWYVKLKRGMPDAGLEENRSTYTAFSVILAAGILLKLCNVGKDLELSNEMSRRIGCSLQRIEK